MHLLRNHRERMRLYDFIEEVQILNSFIALKVLYESEDSHRETQIYERIS